MLFISPKKLFSCSWLFGHVTKRLDKKDKVNFKFYDVTVWLANNSNSHILPNILRSKGNQTMEFGQLTECNMRNIFLEKSYTKWDGETSPRPFSKNSKLSILLFFFFYSRITHLNRKFTVTRNYIIWCVWESTSKNLLQSQLDIWILIWILFNCRI